jgi:hypothetical protein
VVRANAASSLVPAGLRYLPLEKLAEVGVREAVGRNLEELVDCEGGRERRLSWPSSSLNQKSDELIPSSFAASAPVTPWNPKERAHVVMEVAARRNGRLQSSAEECVLSLILGHTSR